MDELNKALGKYGQICIAAGTLNDEDLTTELNEASRVVKDLFARLEANQAPAKPPERKDGTGDRVSFEDALTAACTVIGNDFDCPHLVFGWAENEYCKGCGLDLEVPPPADCWRKFFLSGRGNVS